MEEKRGKQMHIVTRDTLLALRQAYFTWRTRYYAFHDLDQKVEPFLSVPICGPTLKEAREAQFLTVARAARHLGVSPVAFVGFEKRTDTGDITLNALKNAAQAINCELIYCIRPKTRTPFSMVMWNQLLPFVLRQKTIQRLNWYYRGNAMATLAHELMNDAEFRRSQQWSERGITEWPDIRKMNQLRIQQLMRG